MNKVSKFALILLITLLSILLLILKQYYPIYISPTSSTIFQIPIFYWLIVILSPILLYVIVRKSENKLVPILCAIFYYFILNSYGLFYMVHPTISDVSSTTYFQELLGSITHIRSAEIAIEEYFHWPVYFFFSKIFSSILGTAPILTINLGYMSLISLFPVFLTIFYRGKNNKMNKMEYFIVTTLYIMLAFYFINAQFVPQFLALIYIFILFGFYIKYQQTKKRIFFVLTVMIYTLTVFTHAFMYMFFLIPFLFEKFWIFFREKKKKSIISFEMVVLLLIIWFPLLRVYFTEFARSSFGGSLDIFDFILSQRVPQANGIQVQHLYHLVPSFYDQMFTFMSKGIVAGAFIIVVIGFLLFFLKKREILDFGILIGAFTWFAMGLGRMVLGQRAVQIAPLALSDHYKPSHKIFSHFSIIIILLILVSPTIFISNVLINESIGAERLIQDYQENVAGKFMDSKLEYKSYIGCAVNAYPTGINFIGIKHKLHGNMFNETTYKYLEFILVSPKLRLTFMYYNSTLLIDEYDSFVYSSKDINIISR